MPERKKVPQTTITIFPERRDIAEWFQNTLNGEGGPDAVIDRAMCGQHGFNPALLHDMPNPDNRVEIFRGNGLDTYSYDRNAGGRNINYMSTTLSIDEADSTQDMAIPIAFTQQTRALLLTDDRERQYSGYTEYNHSYWGPTDSNKRQHRLEQEIAVAELPASVSPTLKHISVHRIALNGVGDMIFGELIMQNREVTNKLGISTPNNGPVFLVFLPDRVLATTYGPGNEVLAEMSYQVLDSVGIRARFTNDTDKAKLSIGAGNLSIVLQLGKKLKPDYAAKLFSPEEEWITDSGISVSKYPQEALN